MGNASVVHRAAGKERSVPGLCPAAEGLPVRKYVQGNENAARCRAARGLERQEGRQGPEG